MKKSLIVLSLMGITATQVNATVEQTFPPQTNTKINNTTPLSNALSDSNRAQYSQSSRDLDDLIASRSQPYSTMFGTSANTPFGTASAASSTKPLDMSAPPAIAAARASQRANSRTVGLCARYVRQALQSAGYEFTPNPSAYQYATRGTLEQAGFVKISNDTPPQVGDIVVYNRSAKHRHGHIQIFDGNNWVSDFRQARKSPYSGNYSYTTWRDARYLNDASSEGVYLAMGE